MKVKQILILLTVGLLAIIPTAMGFPIIGMVLFAGAFVWTVALSPDPTPTIELQQPAPISHPEPSKVVQIEERQIQGPNGSAISARRITQWN